MKKLFSLFVVIFCTTFLWAYDLEVDGIYYNLSESIAEVTSPEEGYYGDIFIPTEISYEDNVYSVERIGEQAFSNTYITSIVLPPSIKTIGDNAFNSCSELNSVEFYNDYGIEASIESIGNGAFSGCHNLTSINLCHSSLISIGDDAFNYCSNLNDIVLYSWSVESIGDRAFYSCSNLTSINLPSSLKSIGSEAFAYCTNLSTLEIPYQVEKIGDQFLVCCSNLSKIEVAPGNPYYIIKNESLLTADGTTLLVVPAANKELDETYIVPQGVTTIASYAFVNNKMISRIVVSEGVLSIGDCAFGALMSGDSIYISLPSTIVNLGGSILLANHNAAITLDIKATTPPVVGGGFGPYSPFTIYVPYGARENYNMPPWNEQIIIERLAIGDVFEVDGIFYKKTDEEICELAGKKSDSSNMILIPTMVEYNTQQFTVTAIGNNAFKDDSTLTAVIIPTSIVHIGNQAFAGSSVMSIAMLDSIPPTTGDAIFDNCSSLAAIYVPTGANDNYNTSPWNEYTIADRPEDGIEFEHDGLRYKITGMLECEFLGGVQDSQTTLTIPSIVEYMNIPLIVRGVSIKEYSYTSIILPNTVNRVYASYMPYLTSVDLPDAVIDFYFAYNPYQTAINIPRGVTNVAKKDNFNMTYLPRLANITVDPKNKVYDSRDNCNAVIETNSNILVKGCKNTVVPNSVTAIGNMAFMGTGISSIAIPNSITKIGQAAFMDCHNLTNVIIPESVVDIESEAFIFCHNIVYITLPSSISSMGLGTFANCTGLKSVTIPSSIQDIGLITFSNCKRLESVTMLGTSTPEEMPYGASVFYLTPNDLTFYVPIGAEGEYGAWNGGYTTKGAHMLIDSNPYNQEQELTDCNIAYNRTFDNTDWQTWYVPFDIAYSELYDHFTVARLGDIVHFDDDGDGVHDRWELEIIRLNQDDIIKANQPYVIRAQGICQPTFNVDNTTLYAAEEKVFNCSATTENHTIHGVYNSLENNMEPYSWYLKNEYGESFSIDEITLFDQNKWQDEAEVDTIILPKSVTIAEDPYHFNNAPYITLEAKILPSNVKDKSLTWTNSDKGIVILSEQDYFFARGITGVAPGVATITVTANNGVSASCEVTVLPSLTTKAKACESYEWHDSIYTESGTYYYGESIILDNGVEYIETLLLEIVHDADTTVISKIACDEYNWHGVTYTESGTYSYSYTDRLGVCDDVEILHLTINHTETTDWYETACETYEWHGETYTESGDYEYRTTIEENTEKLYVGYDSQNDPIIGLTPPRGISRFTVDGFITEGSGSCFVGTGTPENGIVDDNGDLRIFDAGYLYYDRMSGRNSHFFDDYRNPFNIEFGNYYAKNIETGEYYFNKVNESYEYSNTENPLTLFYNDYGKIHKVQFFDNNDLLWADINAVIEGGVPMIIIDYYETDGTIYQTQKFTENLSAETKSITKQGCDRVEWLHLTVNKTQHARETITACDSYTWNGETYTQSGEYVYTTIAANGCDSIVTLHLTINKSEHVEESVTACDSYEWNGITYTESGDYEHYTTTDQGCERVEVLHLTINRSEREEYNVTACDQYEWHDHQYTESGDYEYYTITDHGCARVEILHLTINRSEREEYSVTACDQYEWHGEVYTESGTYEYHTTTDQGCERVEVLHLTINHSEREEYWETACNEYWWHDNLYTESGDYEYYTTTDQGCERVEVLHLTINNSEREEYWETACNEYYWDHNGETYYESGDYEHYTITDQGCERVEVLHLTINNSEREEYWETACNEYYWDHNGETYYESGDYEHYTITDQGCERVEVLHLTINHSEREEYWETACNEYWWHDNLYTESGDYEYYTTTDQGCERVEILHLTINHSEREEYWETACNEYWWHDNLYTESGDYEYYTTTDQGCERVEVLHLTINKSEHVEFTETACDSYVWNGVTYTESGDYTYTTTTAAGCELVEVLHLTINKSEHVEFTETACDSYVWNGITYTESGDYTYNTTTAAGCERVEVLHLTINKSEHVEFTETACDSYEWNGVVYTESGDYTYNTTTADGCERVEVLHLTINKSEHVEFTDTACDSYVWNGVTYTESGDYTYNTTTAAGCERVEILHLTINKSERVEENVTACDSYEWNGVTYTESGDYTYNTTTAAGCERVEILHLTINKSERVEENVTACDSYEWNGVTYTESGDYTYTTTTAADCERVEILHLTINKSEREEYTEVACDEYVWNGVTYTESGDYTYTTTTDQGCERVEVLHLTILPEATTESEELALCPSELPYEWYGQSLTEEGTYSATEQYAGMECDSVIHELTLNVYVQTLPATVTLPIVRTGEAIDVTIPTAEIQAHIAAETWYAPNALVVWYIMENSDWAALSAEPVAAGITEVILKYVVDTDCGNIESDNMVIAIEPTGVENTQSPSPTSNCQKILHEDHIYILRESKIYTITGQEL